MLIFTFIRRWGFGKATQTMENPDFSALPSLIKHLTENSTEDQTIPKFNLNISLSNLSIPFEMMVPHQDNTTIRNYPNLSDFLVDLKTNLSGESEISGWCFWAMIFLYIIVASMGLIGNGLGKLIHTSPKVQNSIYILQQKLAKLAIASQK